jgi:hypothetical protein
VKSPQISAVAAVAAHYGIPVTQILGATTEKAALKHENVLIGAKLGVRFIINPVAYNPALQRRLNEEHARYPDHYRMEYGLSLRAEATPAEIADFHAFGANQVRNLPAVENLIVPAGSCVSATSVLLGLVQHRVAIRDVWLVGIGPSKLSWLWKRLGVLEDYLRTDIRANYAPQGEAFEELSGPESAAGAYRLHFLDLHGRGVVNYQNEKPWSWRGIRMHPTYEGKMFHHLIHHHAELLRDNRSCFWIVGSKPTWAAMRPLIEERKVEQLQLAGLA